MKRLILLAVLSTCCALGAHAQTPTPPAPLMTGADPMKDAATPNGKVVVEWHHMSSTLHKPREAFERYTSPDLVIKGQPPGATFPGDPSVPLRERVIQAVEGVFKTNPEFKDEIIGVRVWGDLVLTTAVVTSRPGAPKVVTIQMEEVKDGKIISHWGPLSLTVAQIAAFEK